VAHTCNLSFSDGRNQEYQVLKPANSSSDAISETPNTHTKKKKKRARAMAQVLEDLPIANINPQAQFPVTHTHTHTHNCYKEVNLKEPIKIMRMYKGLLKNKPLKIALKKEEIREM
jgi:hypothetical protein